MRMAEDAVLRDIPAITVGPLTDALGFHPLMGGRRLGELRCSSLQDGQVYVEMPGSFIPVEQVKMISKILKEITR